VPSWSAMRRYKLSGVWLAAKPLRINVASVRAWPPATVPVSLN
jgi:hypothetical protein